MPCLFAPSSSQNHLNSSTTVFSSAMTSLSSNQHRPLKHGGVAEQGSAASIDEKEERLLALLKRTGYSMIKNNGQRKYGGPPPKWVGPPPSRGSEVFVGKLPRDIMEDELVPLFERCGKIYELRHMMDFSGTNRGFAYVRFSKPAEARRAIDELNNHEIRPGQYIGVMQSVDNCRLFVGGIPRNKTRDEILVEMSRITDNVVDVILKPCAHDKSKNRGFAFVEYETHRDAAMARRKLVPGKMQLWGQMIAVDWAEPEQEVDSDTMARVKILYLSNLMLRTTEETLRERVERIRPGCVERVKKLKDYAFVHFSKREDAEAVLQEIDGTVLDDAVISAEWAKPPDKSLMRFVKNVQKGNGGTGLGGLGPTGSVHHNLVAAATELYSSTANGANGRIQPAMTDASGMSGTEFFLEGLRGQRGAAGLRGAGIRQAIANAAKQTGVKYSKPSSSAVYYDYLSGFSFYPAINPFAFRQFKTASQILEDCCVQCHWGVPQYNLHTTVTKDVLSGGSVTVYEYKITVPALVAQYGIFQCGKLCGTTDEAKELAAFHTLQRLGLAILPSAAASPVMPSPMAAMSPLFPTFPPFSSTIGSPLFAYQPSLFSPGLSPSLTVGMHPMYFPNGFSFPPTPTLLPPPKVTETVTNSSNESSPTPNY